MTSFCFSDISSAFSHRFISQSSLSRVFCFIFNDLLTKSYSPKNNQISRLSFIEYFDLPLLVMERIYKVLFDNKQSISLKVFEDKMKIFTSFNLKEISKFCFQIYDFDNNGNIKPDASKKLEDIFNQISINEKNLYNTAANFVNKNTSSLQENSYYFRNGRLTFLVKSSDKNKFKGYTYGSSASGLAFYVEPESFISLNNKRISLEEDKENEVIHLLRELSEK